MIKAMMRDRATQMRLMRFLVVGGTVAVTQFLVLALIKSTFQPTMAFSLAWSAATCLHYVLNRFWALPSARQDRGRQSVEYLFSIAVSYLANVSVFKICMEILGFTVMWSAICAVPPATAIVFLLLNYRVFREKAD